MSISVVMNAHREGPLAGPTIRSLLAAVAHAEAMDGLDIEVIAVLDRPDTVTLEVVKATLGARGRILEADAGDPGLSRNRGIAEATRDCVALLDGDDLWSYNWLAEAWAMVRERGEVIAHSEVNIIFGQERSFWWHIDSESPLYDPDYLAWANYWDALSFARREIYFRHPYRANDLALGFGHEDWHWNIATLQAGHPHKPVPGTMHFKRRRRGSQITRAQLSDSVPWPDATVRLWREG